MSDLLSTLAGEYEMEPATEGVKEFFSKICDGILWVLRKIKEIVLKIIRSIKHFFLTKSNPHSNSEINAAIREYRTATQNMAKESDNSEYLKINTIPGLTTYNGEKRNDPITDNDVNNGEKVLTSALESVIDTFKAHVEDITKLMGEIINNDNNILKDQSNIITKMKNMSSSLRSTQPINEATIKEIKSSTDKIVNATNACKTTIENYVKVNEGGESKVEKLKSEIKKKVEELPDAIAEVINRIFSTKAPTLITTVKTETANFTAYLEKIEAHAEYYKKSADVISDFITDIKNSAKSGSKLNDATEGILNNVNNIVKANMNINNIFGKLIVIAKVNNI